MTIQQMIMVRMVEATKAKNTGDRDAYRLLRGELDLLHEQPVTDDAALRVFRKLQADAQAYPASFSENFVTILKGIIPANLDAFDTMTFLINTEGLADQIRACKADGQAMGIAMKAFSNAKIAVSSETVKNVVTCIRESNKILG